MQEIETEDEDQSRGFQMMMKDQQRLHERLLMKLEQLTLKQQWFASWKSSDDRGGSNSISEVGRGR
jgi:hypothetical protein